MWRIEKSIPIRSGAWVVYGGTYRWLWMARAAKWLLELCPDLRAHMLVEIRQLPNDRPITKAWR